jgi:lipoprotein-releasing system ATP-binding protein
MPELLRVSGLAKSFAVQHPHAHRASADDQVHEARARGVVPSLPILRDLSLQLDAAQSLAIMGRSGAGKSTLLHLLAGLEKADAGSIRWEGRELGVMRERDIDGLRNRRLGFVYQFHHLIDECSALDNVALPLRIAGEDLVQARSRAAAMLEQLGLGGRFGHTPSLLSGGERQRVAVARALIHRPACVLADEPTGNLDDDNAAQVFALFRELIRDGGAALLLVTHDAQLAAQCDAQAVLDHGRLRPLCR